jgi:fatty-acyl-CoA synthase
MQDEFPLTTQHILERMRRQYGDREVVTRTADGTRRARYAEVAARADRLCGVLERLGVQRGDRVGTLMWNTQEHLEMYLGVPSMGAVLHTLNLRLSEDQLVYVINHARDRVIVVEDSLVPTLEPVLERLETVEHIVVVADATALPDALHYEDLLAREQPGYEYPRLDDREAAALCYTSGTTGDPKGVLYSHRSIVLHATGQCMADNMAMSSRDRAMPVVPMFHVNAWGIPYSACLTGADLVMPGRFVRAEALARLIEQERVTVSGAVPTVWSDLLRYADEHDPDLSSVRMLACGGAKVPLSLMRDFEERHGVFVVQVWGMTETSPLTSVALPPPDVDGEDAWRYRDRTGRVLPLVESRIVDGDGRELPWDGVATGEIQLRGPWIASAYYECADGDARFDGGWLRTGDIASIDERGYIQITDRAKDIIKSGGEWISSIEMEAQLASHPCVLEVAVIAKPDDRFTERPLPCVVLEAGASVGPEELRAYLVERVPRWWIPAEFAFIDEVPKTSTGKFDKKLLRARLESGSLTMGTSVAPAGRAIVSERSAPAVAVEGHRGVELLVARGR